jgi:hypothetical protein
MMEDCRAGKIQLIIVKRVSRFARNVKDFAASITELSTMNPPIGVYFEEERLYSLDTNNELTMNFLSTMAQEESHQKSEMGKGSVKMRFMHGIFLTPVLLGYDNDEHRDLVINENEAKTVRLIFNMCLDGYATSDIADTLTVLGRETKQGNTKWSTSSVLCVLKNERHCGMIIAWKSYTVSYLTHQTRKNKGQRDRYKVRDHHDAIVTYDDWLATQLVIANSRFGSVGYLPKLNVTQGGELDGFVTVNPRWGAFSVEDYREASASAERK